MSRTTSGEIREIYHGNCRAKYEWIVPYAISPCESRWTCAPTFECYGVAWEFKIHSLLGGRLYLCLSRQDNTPGSIRFTVSIKTADGSEEMGVRDRRIPEGYGGWSLRRFVCHLELYRLVKLMPKSELTVTCKMVRNKLPCPGIVFTLNESRKEHSSSAFGRNGGFIFTPNEAEKKYSPVACRNEAKNAVSRETQTERESGTDGRFDHLVAHLFLEEKTFASEETQTEEVSYDVKGDCDVKLDVKVDPSLQKHLEDLLISGDDHDITINVRNRKFRAHRGMLRARSPVFAAMFKHDTKESASNSITIDDCDPDAFCEFLHYVYTGRVEDLSPEKATGLYYAADKYDLSGLKEVCVQFLETSLSKTSICDVISLATTHGENDLLEKAIRFFSENTVEILMTVEWQRFAAKNFVAANELCIKAFEALKIKSE